MFDIGADLQRAFDEGYENGKADRPQGEWIKDEYDISRCSECNCINNTVYKNFCPNCGAKMKGADDVLESDI